MNFDEPQAGPELDRLIAAKVMGWHLVEEDEVDSSFDWWGDGHGADRIKYCTTSVGVGYHGDGWQVWAPSTNIAHAWEVAERITSRHALFVEVQSPVKLGERDPRHYVVFRGIAGQAWGAQAESVPLAICRSALRALAK